MKLCPFQGIKFLFFDQFKSVPHKIYDICCYEMRMSATSLTFWFKNWTELVIQAPRNGVACSTTVVGRFEV